MKRERCLSSWLSLNLLESASSRSSDSLLDETILDLSNELATAVNLL